MHAHTSPAVTIDGINHFIHIFLSCRQHSHSFLFLSSNHAVSFLSITEAILTCFFLFLLLYIYIYICMYVHTSLVLSTGCHSNSVGEEQGCTPVTTPPSSSYFPPNHIVAALSIQYPTSQTCSSWPSLGQ